jgi:hypothetical protein
MNEPHIPPGDSTDTAGKGIYYLWLTQSEWDEFLEWLFTDIAKSPGKLGTLETIKVARYILKVALMGTPKSPMLSGEEERRLRQQVRDFVQILLTVWIHNDVTNEDAETASVLEALAYLRKHTGTHLTHPYTEITRQFIESFQLADSRPKSLPNRRLVSRSMQVSAAKPKFQDDLSERIYVAYYALTNSKCGDVRRRIARALERFEIRRNVQGKSQKNRVDVFEWDDEDVYDRAKKFELTFCVGPGRKTRKGLEPNRIHIPQIWIERFRYQRSAKT